MRVYCTVLFNQLQDSMLKIKSVKEEDEAMYQCKASNQLGSSYSSAQLKVLSKCQLLSGSQIKYSSCNFIYAILKSFFT